MPTQASSGFLTLYISGPNKASGLIDLYTAGVSGYLTKGLDLYVRPHDVSSGPLNLYMQVNPPGIASGTLDLYLNASNTGTTGLYKGLNLYIPGDVMTSNLNLTITGTNLPFRYENEYGLNLYLHNYIPNIQSSIDLYILGSTNGNTLGYVYKSTDLFIQGQGLIAGATPYSGWMNLYLHHLGTEKALNLFLNANGPTTSYVDLYLNAISGYLSNGLNLTMPRYGYESRLFDLFIRGWDDGSMIGGSGSYSILDLNEYSLLELNNYSLLDL